LLTAPKAKRNIGLSIQLNLIGLCTNPLGMKIKPEAQTYKLEEVNKALVEPKNGKIRRFKVLVTPS
jgi:D-arabinose 1-dehydrogenase-like Zn-dependent alcohol dehydrogenase